MNMFPQIDSSLRLRQHSHPVDLSPLKNSTTPDLLLVNPLAGGGHAASALPRLQTFATQRGWNLDICITSSKEDLSAKARHAAEDGRKRIFVLGGDGTLQILVNAVADFPEIILGVIPAGGGNDFAASLGLPPDPVQAATLLLDGEVAQLDLARVRTADGVERLYTGGGGVGLDAEAARHASGSYRTIRGRTRYILAAVHALLSFRPFRVNITHNGSVPNPLQANVLLAGILNTPSYGAGLYLAPDAKTDDGILELVVMEDLTALQILRLLPTFTTRGQLNTNRLRRLSVTHVRIETESPLWFHGDGELLGMTPVEVFVVPRAVRILRPAQKQTS